MRFVGWKKRRESLIRVQDAEILSRSTWTVAKFARDSSAYKFKARRAVRIPPRSPSVQIPWYYGRASAAAFSLSAESSVEIWHKCTARQSIPKKNPDRCSIINRPNSARSARFVLGLPRCISRRERENSFAPPEELLNGNNGISHRAWLWITAAPKFSVSR